MKLTSKYLGEIEYEENNIIYFNEGLPGFETSKKFIFVMSDQADLPFHYLLSVDTTDVSFIVTNPFLFVESYDFEISDDVIEALEIQTPEDLFVYTIVTTPAKAEFSTINLAAPLIINTNKNLGKQIILEEVTDIRHPIFKLESEKNDPSKVSKEE